MGKQKLANTKYISEDVSMQDVLRDRSQPKHLLTHELTLSHKRSTVDKFAATDAVCYP
jgi:hypothetical protein